MAGKKGMHNKNKAKVPIDNENRNNPKLSQDNTGFVELFSLLGGLNQNFLVNNPYLSNNILKSLSPLPKKYTREEINAILSNPSVNEDKLVSLSEYVKNVILQYKKAIEYYSSLNKFTPFVYPVGVDEFDLAEKKFKPVYKKAISLVEDLEIGYLTSRITEGILTEDAKFYYLANTDYGFRLVELPRQYCKITYWSQELGMWLFSFNMMWFVKAGVDIREYGDWWVNAFEEMEDYQKQTLNNKKDIQVPYDVNIEKRHDGSYAFWKELSVGFGWCFKYNLDSAIINPPLSGLFNDALSIETYKQMYADSAVLQNWKMILNKIGFKDSKNNSSDNNDLRLTADMAKKFNDMIQEGLPKGVKSTVSPFEGQEVVDFSKNAQTKDDIVGSAQQNFFNSIGINQNVMGGGAQGGAMGTTYSHYSDTTTIKRNLEPQLKAFINYLLRTNITKYRFRIDFVITTEADRDKVVNMYLNASRSGLPVTRLCAALGISQSELQGELAMEKILKLKESLIPLMSSNTMNSNDMLDNGGRPNKDKTEISDNTAKSIDNGKGAI